MVHLALCASRHTPPHIDVSSTQFSPGQRRCFTSSPHQEEDNGPRARHPVPLRECRSMPWRLFFFNVTASGYLLTPDVGRALVQVSLDPTPNINGNVPIRRPERLRKGSYGADRWPEGLPFFQKTGRSPSQSSELPHTISRLDFWSSLRVSL